MRFATATRRWAPFTGKHYELGLTISGRPVEIYALFGGQWPHSSYMVPGGVMCAPTLTDVTRAWAILEHFRRNWIEPVWLGCSLERYEQITSYDGLMAWMDETRAQHESDLALFWRLLWRIGIRQPGALVPFLRAFSAAALRNRRAVDYVGMLAAVYLHVGPFSRFVITELDRQIAEIDAGRWQAPLALVPPTAAAAAARPEAA